MVHKGVVSLSILFSAIMLVLASEDVGKLFDPAPLFARFVADLAVVLGGWAFGGVAIKVTARVPKESVMAALFLPFVATLLPTTIIEHVAWSVGGAKWAGGPISLSIHFIALAVSGIGIAVFGFAPGFAAKKHDVSSDT
ncbi:hypothetical protein EBS80_03430 [bacterium]|nr:hypothetical protein [bacterium]